MVKWYWQVVGVVIAFGIVVIMVFWLHAGDSVIPGNIRQKLGSTLLLPQGSQFVVDKETVKYNPSASLLTYYTSAFGHKILMSEEPTPQSFTDVPAAYQKVIDGMNSYSNFGTADGTVYLTLPPQLSGEQAAVLNGDGTLTFAKSSVHLSQSQWQQYFDSFQVVH